MGNQGSGVRVQSFGFSVLGLGVQGSRWFLWGYRDTSLIRNSPLPPDHHRILGIVLL